MDAPFSIALDTRIGATSAIANARIKAPQTTAEKARAQAQDFEAVFINSMLQHMFTAIGDEGPLGNGKGVGIWRSFLTEEYSKSFAKAGGLGLADQIYPTLLAQQETQVK